VQNLGNARDRHAKIKGQPIHSEMKGGHELFFQDFAGMDRAQTSPGLLLAA
jgi:hypothetical protein